MPGEYDQTLSQQYPGLFVILLDQSESMKEVDQNGQSKASLVTTYVNRILQKMIDLAQVDEFSGRRKNYAYVSILGYNDEVEPLLSRGSMEPLSLPDLDDSARGKIFPERLILDESGKIVRRVREKMRFWVEPKTEGKTDMTLAFEVAEKVIQNWLNSPPEAISQGQHRQMQMPRSKSFPPILLNITDAKHNGRRDPEDVIERIRRMRTEYGQVLIYNCHFTHEGSQPCAFPANIGDLKKSTLEKQAERMFYISSEMPDILRDKARRHMRMPIDQGARCFVYNANPDVLLKFLQWTTLGTSGGGRER